MKKIIYIIICFLLICTTVAFASNDERSNKAIYDAVQFDYCYLTGISEENADEIFEEIMQNDVLEIVENIESRFGLSDKSNEDIILYIQENYDNIKEELSEIDKHNLDVYILYTTINYYNEHYEDIVSKEKLKDNVSNYDCANIVPVEDSIINSQLIDSANLNAAQSGYINMRVFADPNGYVTGSSGLSLQSGAHAWIVVYNNSGGNITVGRMSIANGTEISIGTWGNKYNNNGSLHKGVWYNLEPYLAKYNSVYSDNVSKSCNLTTTQLATLNNYINSHDTWSTTTNCSSFAVGAWNTVVGYNQLSAGIINTPKNLANSIINTTVYTDDLTMRYYYRVHYSNGTGTPIMSTQFTNTY